VDAPEVPAPARSAVVGRPAGRASGDDRETKVINHFSMTRLDEDLFAGLDTPVPAVTRRAESAAGGSPAADAADAGEDGPDAAEAGQGHATGPLPS